MIVGIDTSFLVAYEVSSHKQHADARRMLGELLSGESNSIALVPQVLAEFVEIISDPARFERPLTSEQAISRAEDWWRGKEVQRLHSDDQAMALFLKWMSAFKLGRKRILDALLAATYYSHGVGTVATTNARDFSVFGVFEIRSPVNVQPASA